jgi:prepilin-type N-terminal cleavage/methylation domain-containing protein
VRPAPLHPAPPRRAYTLIELLVALTIVATLLGVAAPRLSALHDRAVVRGAAVELGAMLATTRRAAMLRSSTAALVLDQRRATVTVLIGTDTIISRPLGEHAPGLRLTATRDTIRYGPSGRGLGAANATISLQRGGVADTTRVSRLGRVRRG